MSLFKSRELWSTFCSKEEQFDNGCMTVANILEQDLECIIVGSHSGILRIFQPEPDSECDAEGYRPTDLLIETQLPQPVIQVAVGKLVSGSQNKQVGVLHPRSVAVYSLVAILGSAQHGDQYHLVMAYEHQLSRSAYSFLIGPFGGAKGRDFICIQSLDGTLSFFEQETFAVSRSLPCFLLPSPFVYVPSSDSFVVLNANWMLESYRYEVLADSNRKLVAWWTLNLGEAIVAMEVVVTQGSKSVIYVLGERNLYCLREGGSIDMVKRLQFTPCCLHPYMTEPERKAMALVVADTATLLVYDMAALCWSSQLPFVPVVMSRVNLKSIQGLIALLSEEGQLVCCYLGTEPAVFVPPPISNKAQTYNDLQQRLFSLQQEIDASSQMAALQATEGHELNMSVRTLSLTEPSECQLVIRLSPSTALNSVQVTVTATAPLTVVPPTHHLPSLCETVEVSSLVMLLPTHTVPVLSLDVCVVAVYVSNNTARVLQATAVLPIALVLQPSAPTKQAEHRITLATAQPIVPLNQLFPELTGEQWEAVGCSEAAVGLAHRSAPTLSTATVILGKGEPRYRIQGDSTAALCLVVSQLVTRLEARHRAATPTVTYQVTSLPTTSLLAAIDRHIELRNQITLLQEKLGQQTTQYRAIQRRLLSKLREKTVLPLVGLDRLLADTHRQIGETSHAIEDTQLALAECSCELSCEVRLVLTLVRLCDSTSAKDWADLAAAMSYVQHTSESQGWEEVCEPGVNYLLSTSLAKSVRDHQRTAVDPLRDPARFKKHITVALDRVVAGTAARPKEEQRGVSPIMEEEDCASAKQTLRRGSSEKQAYLKLLPAREALQTNAESRHLEAAKEGHDDEDDTE